MKHTILCVDDEPDTVDSLGRLFRKKYRVLKSTSGPQALDLLKNETVSLIISDQRMPEMTGVEFLEKSLEDSADSLRILLTGYTDIDSVVGAINSGQIYRYITKPWDPVDLLATVDQAIEKYEMRAELDKKNRELSAALEELKSLDVAKTHFMLLINHELKTPLTSLVSFLHLLKESSLDEEQGLYVKRIDQATTRLNTLIDDVLLLIKAETGALELSPQDIEAKDLFEPILQKYQSEMESKNLQAEISGSATVHSDVKHLTIVLERICHNAIKFSNPESPIQVSLQESKISIFNQGPVIPAEKISAILKPFVLNEDILNHSTGTGLGLSLCQAILKQLGSVLDIQSDSKGTTVSFQLNQDVSSNS